MQVLHGVGGKAVGGHAVILGPTSQLAHLVLEVVVPLFACVADTEQGKGRNALIAAALKLHDDGHVAIGVRCLLLGLISKQAIARSIGGRVFVIAGIPQQRRYIVGRLTIGRIGGLISGFVFASGRTRCLIRYAIGIIARDNRRLVTGLHRLHLLDGRNKFVCGRCRCGHGQRRDRH